MMKSRLEISISTIKHLLWRRQVLEALLVAGAFLSYFGVRGAVILRPEIAFDHAMDLILVQRHLGFFWEDNLQNWIINDLFIVQAMNIIYFWLHRFIQIHGCTQFISGDKL